MGSIYGIPSNPDKVYGDEWNGWYDLCGTTPPVTSDTRISYNDLQLFVKEKGIKGKEEYREWCNNNSEERLKRGIPYNPDRDYGDECTSWAALFDKTPNVTSNTRISYNDLQLFVKEKGIKGADEYREWCNNNSEERKKRGIPYNPDQAYGDEWIDWYDLCGTTPPVTSDTRISYNDLQLFVKEKCIKGADEYREWCKNNSEERKKRGIPYNPNEAYGDKWINWYDLCGTTPPVRSDTRISYNDLQQFVKEKGIKSQDEYREWCNNNSEERLKHGIPSDPYDAYGDEWISFNDLFGTTPPVRSDTRISYNDLQLFVKEKGIKGADEYREWCNNNSEERLKRGIPSAPDIVYGDEWKNWYDLLSKKK